MRFGLHLPTYWDDYGSSPTHIAIEETAKAAETLGYDGVWANACLLHVPRPDLAHVLALIWRALKPGGYFYASFKTGDTVGRDTLNRYYNYPTEEWLRATYAAAGDWSELLIETGEVRGFDDKQAPMLFVLARKSL